MVNFMTNMINFTMQESLREFLEYKLATKLEFQQYLKDKSIPLEERWNLFTGYGIHLLDETCDCPYLNWDNGEEIFIYDDFYINRHQSVWYTYLVDCIIEYTEDNPEYNYSEDRLNKLKEQILSNGYSSFLYDW